MKALLIYKNLATRWIEYDDSYNIYREVGCEASSLNQMIEGELMPPTVVERSFVTIARESNFHILKEI